MASASLQTEIFYDRVRSYANATAIAVKDTGCHKNWGQLGLPDMRGFTPHLRTIRLNKSDDWIEFVKGKRPSERQLWLIHDFLHILFYDYATLNLGRELWQDPVRFLECHLASEAFAVLALDYHVSPGSVASSYNLKDWKGFQKEHGNLPSPDSWEMCQSLTQYYLGTPNMIIDPSLMERKAHTSIQKKFQIWLGHELRYAAKQLFYTSAWRHDLAQKGGAVQAESVESSVVAGPLWELLSLATRKTEGALWKQFTKDVAGFIKKQENFFASQSKFTKKLSCIDFRFTGVKALSWEQVMKAVGAAHNPEPSALFLFWQILTLHNPSDFSKDDRSKIKELASSAAQSSKATPTAPWKHAQHLCLELLADLKWTPNSLEKAVFFLP